MPNEQRIREIIREELANFIGSDRYIFQKHLQLLDGRNIQVGRTTGTSFGTATDQKVSLYGITSVVQAGAISSPSADVDSLKIAVDALRTAIKNFGISA